LQKLKTINNIKAQNILKLKMNEQEEQKEQINSYVTFALNDEFFNFDSTLFEIFSQVIKELLQNFF